MVFDLRKCIPQVDPEIDLLMYQLYGVSDEEKIVLEVKS